MESQQHPEAVKGLLLFAPAIDYYEPHTNKIIPIGNALSYVVPRIIWVERRDDVNPIKYQSVSINSAHQLNKIMGWVNANLEKKPFNIPIFVAQSADDATVNAGETLRFFELNKSPNSRMLWFAQTASPQRDPRIHTVISSIPALKVISMSHVSLLSRETDPYYGKQGTIKECVHYTKNSPEWITCNTSQNIYLGASTPDNLKHYLLRQLTYNPFFNDMMGQIMKFFNTVTPSY